MEEEITFFTLLDLLEDVETVDDIHNILEVLDEEGFTDLGELIPYFENKEDYEICSYIQKFIKKRNHGI
tara:strand:+ start:2313 stop:2519 length:207 start_codon:yes stop_codon:yes gene_type:complete